MPIPEQKPLNAEEKRVILDKGTERPFTGKFNDFNEEGLFVCRQCGAALYRSTSKFNSGCGWPSFDDEIMGAVTRYPDADGIRVEIVCTKCDGHLGHVFQGENLTPKNSRHCVNSVSIDFVEKSKYETALFASGCFWGTEYHLQKIEGVLATTVGYIGGSRNNPTYEEVCSGATGHAEAVEVIFDPDVVGYEKLARIFFETHDPSQLNRQGPDIGTQYRSEVFCFDEGQREIIKSLISKLRNQGIDVVTKVSDVTEFWDAEFYHQDYYLNKGQEPYCHIYQKKFFD